MKSNGNKKRQKKIRKPEKKYVTTVNFFFVFTLKLMIQFCFCFSVFVVVVVAQKCKYHQPFDELFTCCETKKIKKNFHMKTLTVKTNKKFNE